MVTFNNEYDPGRNSSQQLQSWLDGHGATALRLNTEVSREIGASATYKPTECLHKQRKMVKMMRADRSINECILKSPSLAHLKIEALNLPRLYRITDSISQAANLGREMWNNGMLVIRS